MHISCSAARKHMCSHVQAYTCMPDQNCAYNTVVSSNTAVSSIKSNSSVFNGAPVCSHASIYDATHLQQHHSLEQRLLLLATPQLLLVDLLHKHG